MTLNTCYWHKSVIICVRKGMCLRPICAHLCINMTPLAKNERVIIVFLCSAVLLGAFVHTCKTRYFGYHPPIAGSVSEREAPSVKKIIDINMAEEKELVSLKGIGPVLAGRIISFRLENGPFRAIEDILKVKGIGPAKYAKIKESITVD